MEMDGRLTFLCDRCGAMGSTGDGAFGAIADVLHFAPAPPSSAGWDPALQRAFVVALAMTGSARVAAQKVGRHLDGAEELRRGKGAAGFARAWDEALGLHRERELRGLATWASGDGRDLPPGIDAEDEEANGSLFAAILATYRRKLDEEATARAAGRRDEADFALRQLSWLEVAVEIALPDDVERWLEARGSEATLVNAPATSTSIALAEARAAAWRSTREPNR